MRAPLDPRPFAILLSVPLILAGLPLGAQSSEEGRIVADAVPAPSLAGNLLGDSTRQPAFVYLPPGYEDERDRRYPTIYLLHGILDSPEVWVEPVYQGMTIQAVMDSLIADEEMRPAIVVMVNGRNAYGASLYMNSPVTGRWEDYVVKDVVRHIDASYRTIPRAGGRALVGHSMGGFGAIRLAMRHPDVFSVAWGMNPCCLCCVGDETPADHPVWRALPSLDSPEEAWRRLDEEGNPWPLIVAGAGTVLSPAPDEPPLFFEPLYRVDGDSVVRTGAHTRVEQTLPLAEVAERAEALRSLRGLAMDLAFDDEFEHIPAATLAFSDSLIALEIPHLFEAYDGDHRNRMAERLPGRVLPWVDRLLDHEGQSGGGP